MGVIDSVSDVVRPDEPVVWTFTATDWVKGRLDPGAVAIEAPRGSDSCGFVDDAVGELGVFVRVHRGRLAGGPCNVTTPSAMRALAGDTAGISNVGIGEVAALDGFPIASPPIEIVTAAPSTTSQSSTQRTWLGWLSGFAAVSVVLGVSAEAVTFLRRRR